MHDGYKLLVPMEIYKVVANIKTEVVFKFGTITKRQATGNNNDSTILLERKSNLGDYEFLLAIILRLCVSST